MSIVYIVIVANKVFLEKPQKNCVVLIVAENNALLDTTIVDMVVGLGYKLFHCILCWHVKGLSSHKNHFASLSIIFHCCERIILSHVGVG